jgi:hypothetical protein
MTGVNISLLIVNSSFTSNVQGFAGLLRNATAPDSSGGAVSMAVPCGYVEVRGSRFTGNKAVTGAAIAMVRGGRMNVTHSFIEGNHAQRLGGGVLLWGDGFIFIKRSVFQHNLAAAGGAVYCYEGDILVSGTEFTNNTAVRGGAVAWWAAGAGDSSLSDCQFVDNTAILGKASIEAMLADVPAPPGGQGSAVGAAGGGAVYLITSGAPLTLAGTKFTGNRAPTGGEDAF